MDAKTGAYQIVDLPPGRRMMINMLDLSGSKHRMIGLLEVDVTVPRQFMAEHKQRTGETLSFTGYLVLCLGRAVDENKAVQAYRKGSKQLILFDNVDVGIMVEHKTGEKRGLMGHVVREANHKTYRQIHDEIRSVQSAPLPPNRGLPPWFKQAMLLPWPFSAWFKAILNWVSLQNPALVTAMGGTVSITSVGMFGEGHRGWGIFQGPEVLGLVVGSIACEPACVEERIEPREILHLTVVFDHDIIDGAPAARFTRRMIELIESGYGLGEDPPLESQSTG
jgi:pyruvate/2-oxoglutarate dehydrogenase complex dihydrolipoamide acyltransferase (E2) component